VQCPQYTGFCQGASGLTQTPTVTGIPATWTGATVNWNIGGNTATGNPATFNWNGLAAGTYTPTMTITNGGNIVYQTCNTNQFTVRPKVAGGVTVTP
jgi:hypothetical protein